MKSNSFNNQVIGKALEHYRIKSGMNQHDLSVKTDIPQPTLSRIEAGQSITVDKLIYILAAVAISPRTFFYRVKNFKVKTLIKVSV